MNCDGDRRRNIKTVSYLGGIDRQCGNPATTRNWSTINTIEKNCRSERTLSDVLMKGRFGPFTACRAVVLAKA